MKKIKISNIGPLSNVNILLSRINLLIGPQSSGKSCILKIASFCAWTEKSIELNQSEKPFLSKDAINRNLVDFHNLQGYFNDDSYIEYETDTMRFSYTFRNDKYEFEWKEGRWDYKRSKIAYIVAERNVLSVIPNWYDLKFPNNSILDFLRDFSRSRKDIDGGVNVLATGVKYVYDNVLDKDMVVLENGNKLKIQNVSSGLQSLVPLYVYATFITDGIFRMDMRSVRDQNITDNLLNELKKTHPDGKFIDNDGMRIMVSAKEPWEIVDRFTKYDHTDIFMEEPEENLFPETQHDLVNWLAGLMNGERRHSLFIATHSPYIMSAFNNLIQAGDIIEEFPEKRSEVEKIIGGSRAVSYDDVAAFAITDGTVHPIKDDELRLISPSELDTASDNISNVFNQLLQL